MKKLNLTNRNIPCLNRNNETYHPLHNNKAKDNQKNLIVNGFHLFHITFWREFLREHYLRLSYGEEEMERRRKGN